MGKYILSNLETQGLVPNTVCKLDMAMWCDCITITEIILALVGWLESRSLVVYTGLKLYIDEDGFGQDPLVSISDMLSHQVYASITGFSTL